MSHCPACGWPETATRGRPLCKNLYEIVLCPLNAENRRKWALRFKGTEIPMILRSMRYQGEQGKGDSYERLIPVDAKELDGDAP